MKIASPHPRTRTPTGLWPWKEGQNPSIRDSSLPGSGDGRQKGSKRPSVGGRKPPRGTFCSESEEAGASLSHPTRNVSAAKSQAPGLWNVAQPVLEGGPTHTERQRLMLLQGPFQSHPECGSDQRWQSLYESPAPGVARHPSEPRSSHL